MQIHFAPNISWLFPELPFNLRPDAVAGLGFKAIEFGFPSHADIDAIADAQERLGFEVTLFNQDVPVWDAANRGYLVDPARRDEFKHTLDEALAIAKRLNARKVMLPAGVILAAQPRAMQRACMVENLEYAAPLAEQAGVIFTLEFLNPIDNPGYFLATAAEAIEIVREINHPQIRFQFDSYHIYLMEGQLSGTLADCGDVLGHIQFADSPGRHEPGTGEVDFRELVKWASQVGYQGPVGLEYIPSRDGGEALDWCASFTA